ncbi:VOC family protein [Synechococcus sp. UW179B]|uniref:VOC family protein n=1 Tax=Synechococcus sp. UW179B TaxID=2575516 RepID=UPI001482830A|nr:VOC family protein [Synechococcus sp. UW179B]
MNTIRHIGIVVKNPEESLVFWRDLLGFTVYADNLEEGSFIDSILNQANTTVRTIKLRDEKNQSVELLHFRDLSSDLSQPTTLFTPGITHIALQVQDIHEIVLRLRDNGYRSLSEPNIAPNQKAKVVFINGPENLYLELVELN